MSAHICMYTGCDAPAEPWEDYCTHHLEMQQVEESSAPMTRLGRLTQKAIKNGVIIPSNRYQAAA